MADFSYDSYDGDGQALVAPGKVRRLTHGAGAIISVALVIGLVAWAWQIAVRDARGVPVIHALEGPMRIAPEDPGGVQMAHQGLAVNTVAAVGEVAAPADRLMLAPKPVELSDDDQAGYAPMPPSAVVPTLTPTILAAAQAAEEGTSTAVLEGDAALIEMEPEADSSLTETSMAVAPSEAAPVPLAADAMANSVTDALAEALDAEPVPVTGGTAAAVTTSPRPVPRPAARPGLAAKASADAAPKAAPGEATLQEVATLDGAQISVGTRLVQLGAYDDEAAAKADWRKLAAQYDAYFKGKDPVIQQAASGGKTFFRLRAHGFANEDEARQFCAVLLNDRVQCIPVRVR